MLVKKTFFFFLETARSVSSHVLNDLLSVKILALHTLNSALFGWQGVVYSTLDDLDGVNSVVKCYAVVKEAE